MVLDTKKYWNVVTIIAVMAIIWGGLTFLRILDGIWYIITAILALVHGVAGILLSLQGKKQPEAGKTKSNPIKTVGLIYLILSLVEIFIIVGPYANIVAPNYAIALFEIVYYLIIGFVVGLSLEFGIYGLRKYNTPEVKTTEKAKDFPKPKEFPAPKEAETTKNP